MSVGKILLYEFLSYASEELISVMKVGLPRKEWKGLEPRGSCEWCLSECNGHRCGTHIHGCFYVGGVSYLEDFWVYHPDCPLYHGEYE